MRTLELNAGKDSLRLSRLVFGTGSVGGSIAFDEAADLLDLYRAEGGCCIDTARMYGKGASEEAILRCVIAAVRWRCLRRADFRQGTICIIPASGPLRFEAIWKPACALWVRIMLIFISCTATIPSIP